MYTLTLCEQCKKVTIAMSQSMYFSSLDMREAYFSILVDGPPRTVLWSLCSPIFRSYTIKAVQNLIVFIPPFSVLFPVLADTGGYVATPNSIAAYKIDSFSTFGSSAQTVNPWIMLSPPEIKSLNAPLIWLEGDHILTQDKSNIGDTDINIHIIKVKK